MRDKTDMQNSVEAESLDENDLYGVRISNPENSNRIEIQPATVRETFVGKDKWPRIHPVSIFNQRSDIHVYNWRAASIASDSVGRWSIAVVYSDNTATQNPSHALLPTISKLIYWAPNIRCHSKAILLAPCWKWYLR